MSYHMDDFTNFATMDDAIAYVRESLGDFADDYDCEAIAREATDWHYGRLYLAYYDSEYWAIVARHDISC